jgi:hypothetical protein
MRQAWILFAIATAAACSRGNSSADTAATGNSAKAAVTAAPPPPETFDLAYRATKETNTEDNPAGPQSKTGKIVKGGIVYLARDPGSAPTPPTWVTAMACRGRTNVHPADFEAVTIATGASAEKTYRATTGTKTITNPNNPAAQEIDLEKSSIAYLQRDPDPNVPATWVAATACDGRAYVHPTDFEKVTIQKR